MTTAVFHAKNFADTIRMRESLDNGTAVFPRDFVLAATVDTPSVDAAYQFTNSIDRPWYLNKTVAPTGLSLRSTSVGDVIVTESGEELLVASIGFEPLRRPRCTDCDATRVELVKHYDALLCPRCLRRPRAIV